MRREERQTENLHALIITYLKYWFSAVELNSNYDPANQERCSSRRKYHPISHNHNSICLSRPEG